MFIACSTVAQRAKDVLKSVAQACKYSDIRDESSYHNIICNGEWCIYKSSVYILLNLCKNILKGTA